MRFGPLEIALILLVVIIIFGVGKLPEVGRQLGRGIRDFKKYSQGDDDEGPNTPAAKSEPAKSELEITRAKLEATEAKLKALEESTRKSG